MPRNPSMESMQLSCDAGACKKAQMHRACGPLRSLVDAVQDDISVQSLRGVPPLADHVMQFERQVIAVKDSQDLLLASINDVIAELERVRGALPAEDLAQRVMRLADLRTRLTQLGTLLTTVEGRLARIQAHLDQKKAESVQQDDDPSSRSSSP